MTIESGPGGNERAEARAGDFFIVPPHTDLDAFVVRVGGEPEQIDVDGPEGTAQ